MSALHTINGWIDRRFDEAGMGAFRSIRVGLLTFLPLFIAIAIMEAFGLEAKDDATLTVLLLGGAASIGVLLWVAYRSAVWAQKVAVERAASENKAHKNG